MSRRLTRPELTASKASIASRTHKGQGISIHPPHLTPKGSAAAPGCVNTDLRESPRHPAHALPSPPARRAAHHSTPPHGAAPPSKHASARPSPPRPAHASGTWTSNSPVRAAKTIRHPSSAFHTTTSPHLRHLAHSTAGGCFDTLPPSCTHHPTLLHPSPHSHSSSSVVRSACPPPPRPPHRCHPHLSTHMRTPRLNTGMSVCSFSEEQRKKKLGWL